MRLLKKEVVTVSTRALNIRYCELLQKGEKLLAHEFSIAEAREILWIEDELRARIVRAVGHDFYPPDRIEKQHPSDYMISLLKPTIAEPKPAPVTKIKFPVTISNSMGTKVAEFRVEADTKGKADILARKEIRKLGLSGASHKIS